MSQRCIVDRRAFLAGSGAVTAAAAIPAVPASAAPRRRPNILLIVTDDHPLGTEWALPSVVNLLGGGGVNFANGYVTTPLCAPSRASIMSGRYAHNHGVRQNNLSLRLDQRDTVQRYLQDAGYRTGLFGKFLNGFPAERAPSYFDEFVVMPRPNYRGVVWNDNGTVHRIPGYTTTIVRNRAIDFIKRAGDEPWFAYVAPYASHGPYTPESKYANVPVPAWNGNPAVFEADKSDKPPYIQASNKTLQQGRQVRRQQLRTLRSVDDLFKAIRAQLIAQNQLADTLVIFIGDNGFTWADHGWIGKTVPYAPSVRVPFYLSWPAGGLAGGLAGGRTDRRLAANIDIAPTILEAARVRPDPAVPMDGRSLLRPGRRDRLLVEWFTDGPRSSWASTVTPAAQYVEYYEAGGVVFREFYDLRRDPYQLRNLLHLATPETERRLGIARWSARLRRDRT